MGAVNITCILPNNGIVEAIKGLFSPQIATDSRLNPHHLALATRGYRIQSRVLHVPDRYGIFSPGPPRLQVHEGSTFFVMILMLVLTAPWFGTFIFLSFLREDYAAIWKFVVIIVDDLCGNDSCCFLE